VRGARAAAREKRLDRLDASLEQRRDLGHREAVRVPQDECGTLGRRERGEGGERSVVGRIVDAILDGRTRIKPVSRPQPLVSLRAPVVVDELVPGDPVDPRNRCLDTTPLLELGNGGEERLLRQILGERHRSTAAAKEVAVDARERLIVEGSEAEPVEAEGLSLLRSELHGRDRGHLSPSTSSAATRFRRGAPPNGRLRNAEPSRP
jgi:hypothetical protein